jgi:stress responsive alpha/beta barrel protein
MIRHTVFFRFRDDASEQNRRDLLHEYSRFPELFPMMRNFSIGHNISERDQTFEYAFSVEFASEADLKSYLASQAHEEHVVERFRPIVSARAIVSYQT